MWLDFHEIFGEFLTFLDHHIIVDVVFVYSVVNRADIGDDHLLTRPFDHVRVSIAEAKELQLQSRAINARCSFELTLVLRCEDTLMKLLVSC